MENKKMKISVRSFITLLLTFCFIMLALSGICLYVAPQCRVAEEIGWRMLVLKKDQWASIHMTSALVFLILSIIHLLIYNWKAFVAYLKPRASRILSMRPELLFSLLAAVTLLIGAALIVPPFSILPDTHDAIQMHYREKSGIDDNTDERREGRGRGQRGEIEGAREQGRILNTNYVSDLSLQLDSEIFEQK